MSYVSKILIVDDEPRICDSLKVLLSQHGYEVYTCNRGKQAIVELGKKHFDLVLLDIFMPDVDGYHVMDHINSFCCETPVFGVSGICGLAQEVR